jgi:hypothetical protein
MPRFTASLPEKSFTGSLQHRVWYLHEPLPEKIAMERNPRSTAIALSRDQAAAGKQHAALANARR